MPRTREQWTAIERDARRLVCRVLANADPAFAWREAGYASPRRAAAALIEDSGIEHGTTEEIRTRAEDIVAAVLGAFGGKWPESGPTPAPESQPVSLALTPGEYLVHVLHSDPPRARVWTHQGSGVFVGHGGKVRKIAITQALADLSHAADREEGIDRW